MTFSKAVVGIASDGDHVQSGLAEHFARCSFFAIYDGRSRKVCFLRNDSTTFEKDAGLHAAGFLEKHHVNKVVAGNFGVKVKEYLDRKKIQLVMIRKEGMKVQDVLELLEGRIA